MTSVQKQYIFILSRGYREQISNNLWNGIISPLSIKKNFRTVSELYGIYIERYLYHLYLQNPVKSEQIAKRLFNDIHSNSKIPFPDKYDRWLLDIINGHDRIKRWKKCCLERANE